MFKRSASRQINWSTVLEIDLHVYESADFKGRLKCLGSALKAVFKQRPNLDKQQYSSEFLFFKSMKRADYDTLFEAVTACCKQPTQSIDLISVPSALPRIYPLTIITKHLPTLLRLASANLLKSLYLIARATYYLEVAERINAQYSYTNLVVFADMQPCDNLLSQLARLAGHNTITLQHGLYIDYTRFPNINMVNYKNTVCEYFLAWGNSTKKLITKYHPKTKIVICGKPTIHKTLNTEPANYLTVLFDQNLLKSYNKDMLRIAYEIQDKHGLVVNLRLHPRNNPKQYRIRKTTLLNQDLSASAVIIAHTTSLIHEIMRQGKAVYKYKSEIPSIDVPTEVLFETAEELMSKLKSQESETQDFAKLATEYIQSTDQQSLLEYQRFFSNLAHQARTSSKPLDTRRIS